MQPDAPESRAHLSAYMDGRARAHTPMLMTEGNNLNSGFGFIKWIRRQGESRELVTALSTCLGLLRQACPREAPSEKTDVDAEIAQIYRRLPEANYHLQVGLIVR